MVMLIVMLHTVRRVPQRQSHPDSFSQDSQFFVTARKRPGGAVALLHNLLRLKVPDTDLDRLQN